MTRVWIALGSSLSAPAGFRKALGRWPQARIATSNGGYALCVAHGRKPAVYMASDHAAARLFAIYIDNFGPDLMMRASGAERFSGPQLVEHVAGKADRVVVVGMDGYCGDDSYFDGRSAPVGLEEENAAMADRLLEIAERHPHVRFDQYGNPAFPVMAENWRYKSLQEQPA